MPQGRPQKVIKMQPQIYVTWSTLESNSLQNFSRETTGSAGVKRISGDLPPLITGSADFGNCGHVAPSSIIGTSEKNFAILSDTVGCLTFPHFLLFLVSSLAEERNWRPQTSCICRQKAPLQSMRPVGMGGAMERVQSAQIVSFASSTPQTVFGSELIICPESAGRPYNFSQKVSATGGPILKRVTGKSIKVDVGDIANLAIRLSGPSLRTAQTQTAM